MRRYIHNYSNIKSEYFNSEEIIEIIKKSKNNLYSESLIIGKRGRNDYSINHRLINNTLKKPHVGICKLLFRKDDGLIYNNSTGFFINKKLILTAGHSLLYDGNKRYKDVIVIPALSVGEDTGECISPFGGVISSKYSLREEFFDNPYSNDNLDYGAIHLDDNEMYDKIGFHFSPNYNLNSQETIAMSGYEDFDCDFRPSHKKARMIQTSEYILTENYISYDYNAKDGLSGSPIWVYDSNSVCGIHTSNGRNQVNILFNKSVKEDIDVWYNGI